jgi:HAD superfamily hydrolase (TIGR01509 family)
MNKLRLKKELIPLMSKYKVSTPIEALTEVRYEIYNEMIKDPQVILDNRWPHAIDILKVAKKNACKIGLATLSRRKNIEYIIKTLGVKSSLDVIVTADDVSKGKPDPEIYLLATNKLKVNPKNSLAIEDSVNGVKSALAAGLNVIAIATPFTRNNLLSSKVIDPKWIVLDPNNIEEAFQDRITEINKTT